MITVNCEVCGAEFSAKPDRMKKGLSKYCSRPCYYEGRKRNTQKKKVPNTMCSRDGCDNRYYVSPGEQREGRGKYCCHKCYGIAKKGTTLSEEHKKKIGKATEKMWERGVFDAPHIREAYAKQGRSTKGSKWTDEQRRRKSEAMKGTYQPYLHTPEAIAKANKSRIGKKQTPESNEKRSKTMKGRVFTDEHRRNLSIANRNRSDDIYLRRDDHPNWRGGASKEDYPAEFKRMKPIIRKRDENKCKLCDLGLSSFAGVIHHIDANKRNNLRENLILVCRRCHGKIHAKRNTRDPVILAFRSLLNY